jgi:hypothetical protein
MWDKLVKPSRQGVLFSERSTATEHAGSAYSCAAHVQIPARRRARLSTILHTSCLTLRMGGEGDARKQPVCLEPLWAEGKTKVHLVSTVMATNSSARRGPHAPRNFEPDPRGLRKEPVVGYHSRRIHLIFHVKMEDRWSSATYSGGPDQGRKKKLRHKIGAIAASNRGLLHQVATAQK